MTNNEIVVRALANTGITALNEMQQAVLDAGTTKDMVLLSPTGSGKTLAFLLPLLTTLTDEDKKIQAVIILPVSWLCRSKRYCARWGPDIR